MLCDVCVTDFFAKEAVFFYKKSIEYWVGKIALIISKLSEKKLNRFSEKRVLDAEVREGPDAVMLIHFRAALVPVSTSVVRFHLENI